MDRVGAVRRLAGAKGPEDRDLFLRIAEIAPVARMDLPLTGYRNAPGSLSKQVVTCEAGMRKLSIALIANEMRGEGRAVRLRRKSYSYMYHTCSHLHGARRDYTTALLYLMKSFAWVSAACIAGMR